MLLHSVRRQFNVTLLSGWWHSVPVALCGWVGSFVAMHIARGSLPRKWPAASGFALWAGRGVDLFMAILPANAR